MTDSAKQDSPPGSGLAPEDDPTRQRILDIERNAGRLPGGSTS